jgi:hypothetical protein
LVLLLALCAWWTAPAFAREDAPSRRDIVDTVLDIVNRPEFEGSEEEDEGLLLILANMLSDFLDRVKDLRRSDPVVYVTIMGWLVLTVLAIVGHIAWTVWRGGGAGPGSARRVGTGLHDPELASREGRDPARMLARAEAAVREGDRRAAVVWLYLALLFRHERAGLLRFDPSSTGLQYADALARRPEDRVRWLRMLDLHDPVVFGGRTCTDATLETLRLAARGEVTS